MLCHHRILALFSPTVQAQGVLSLTFIQVRIVDGQVEIRSISKPTDTYNVPLQLEHGYAGAIKRHSRWLLLGLELEKDGRRHVADGQKAPAFSLVDALRVVSVFFEQRQK